MIYSIRTKIVLFATCAALPATGLFAQEPATTSTPSVSVPAGTNAPTTSTAPGEHGGARRAKWAALSPAEQQEFKAAHQKAMQDPAVKTAEATKETDKKGFHKTMIEAMLRADPSIKPILEKMRGEGKGKKLDS